MIQQPTNIYVCNVMGDILYCLEDIDKESVMLHPRLNGQWELSFSYTQSKQVYSPAFDVLEEGMYLFAENYGHFKMRQPNVDIDAAKETKDITAYSCDVEFEDKNIKFPINMGQETSLEYLVKYDDNETELLVNPYKSGQTTTGVPYDWIVLYNTYPQQLRLMKQRLNMVWSNQSASYTTSSNDLYFDYYNNLITQIPRLCSKASAISDKVLDVITYEELTGDDSVRYDFVQYITQTKDENDETVAITFEPMFLDRLDELITFYEKYGRQMSLLDIICEKTGGVWKPGSIFGYNADDPDNSDFSLCNKRFQFDIDESAYSFLTSTLAQRSKCVVNFDIMHRKINMTPVEHIGEDTGIVLSYDQLLNTLNITTNEDTLTTRLTVYGADGLSIEQINFGEDQIVDLDYKMNARDRNGRRLYVTDALAEKYDRYRQYRDEVARPQYIEYTRQYNALSKEISELMYRVPADSLSMDWDTMTDEELTGQLKAYTNLLYALQDMYAADYGYIATPKANNSTPWVDVDTLEPEYIDNLPDWFTFTDDATMIPRTEFIHTTIYWWDYVAYRQTITQILIAQQARNDAGVSYKYAEIAAEKGTHSEWFKQISAWETEWDLYGTVELQNKIITYDQQLQTIIDGDGIICEHTSWSNLSSARRACFVQSISSADFNAACQVLQKQKTWSQLSDEDKAYFANESGYVTLLNAQIVSKNAVTWNNLTAQQKSHYGNMATSYRYDVYNDILTTRNEAQAFLDGLLQQLETKNIELTDIQVQRQAVADGVKLAGYEQNGESFSAYEQQVVHLLYRDAEYSNEYILKTSLDDTVSALNAMQELYDDAVEQVRIFSKPQLTFSVDADNLLALPQFQAWQEQFKLGNYMYVEYRDGSYIRLRLVGYGFNPCLPGDNLTLEFSNITYSKTQVSDVESVLGMAMSTTSSGGSSSSGSSAKTLDDLQVALSTTMLERLLTRESFSKEVSNTVREEATHRAAMAPAMVYKGLSEGISDVSGDCIRYGSIESQLRNHDGSAVSMLDLDNVELNLGNHTLHFYLERQPNGAVVLDGEGNPQGRLDITGHVNALSGFIGGVSLSHVSPDNYFEHNIGRFCLNEQGLSRYDLYENHETFIDLYYLRGHCAFNLEDTIRYDETLNNYWRQETQIIPGRIYTTDVRAVPGYPLDIETVEITDGDIVASGTYTGSNFIYSGASGDFAEYYEWLDRNPNAEDRRGRFVTLDGDNIRLANSEDTWIFGIISGTASFVGNTASIEWKDKYIKDSFGAFVIQDVQLPPVMDENGDVIREACTVEQRVLNPEFDADMPYIPRSNRPEWAPVGLVGQIIMLDDGTCEVNGFATSADEGIATKSNAATNYRVIKRIDSNHIMVAAK